MRKCYKILIAVPVLFFRLMAMAQSTVSPVNAKHEPGGFMRSNGKIYVVVAIVLTILAGLLLYVAWLDKKISKMENEAPDVLP